MGSTSKPLSQAWYLVSLSHILYTWCSFPFPSIHVHLILLFNGSWHFEMDQNWSRKKSQKCLFWRFVHSQLDISIRVIIIFKVLRSLFHWKINMFKRHRIMHMCKIPTWITLFSIFYWLLKNNWFLPQLIHDGILLQTKVHKNQVPNKFKIQPLTLIKV